MVGAGSNTGVGTGMGKCGEGATVSPLVMAEGPVCLGLKLHWNHRYH